MKAQVYILQGRDDKFLKVGYSSNPESRARQIGSAMGKRIQVIYTTDYLENAYEVEQLAHTLLSTDVNYREGEWFEVDAGAAIHAVAKAVRITHGTEVKPFIVKNKFLANDMQNFMAADRIERNEDLERARRENIAGAECDEDIVRIWLDAHKNPNTKDYYDRAQYRLLKFLPFGLTGAKVTNIQQFEAHLRETMAASSADTMLAAVRSLFRFAERVKWVPASVAHVIKPDRRPDAPTNKVLSEKEVVAVIQAAAFGRDRVLLEFMYASGARVSEVHNLQQDHLRVIDGHAHVTLQGKGGKTRTIKLARGITAKLLALRKVDTEGRDPVFHARPEGSPRPFKPLSTDAIRDILLRACRHAGITRNVSPHWLRHSHGTHADLKGKPLTAIQDALGHSDPRTTRRYVRQQNGIMLGEDFITEMTAMESAIKALEP